MSPLVSSALERGLSPISWEGEGVHSWPQSSILYLHVLAFFFIANRALNLTLEMDIALNVGACEGEAINNVSYENLIISVFSPLAISLYLCPLSGRI